MKSSYTENEIRKIFTQQGYKYACLKDANGGVRITQNTEDSRGGAKAKVEEAFKRLVNLPDGVYYFCFQNSKGRNVTPDQFPFVKGNVALDGNKTIPYQIIQTPPATKHELHEYEKVLSYPEVMKLQNDLTLKTFELAATKRELDQANATIKELQAELDAAEQKGLSEDPSSPGKWIEQAGTTLVPILDRWLGIKERELALKARDVKRTPPKKRASNQYVLPPLGSPEWDAYLDALEAASDEDFNFTVAEIQKLSPAHYNAIMEEFAGDGEEDEEEEEEETN